VQDTSNTADDVIKTIVFQRRKDENHLLAVWVRDNGRRLNNGRDRFWNDGIIEQPDFRAQITKMTRRGWRLATLSYASRVGTMNVKLTVIESFQKLIASTDGRRQRRRKTLMRGTGCGGCDGGSKQYRRGGWTLRRVAPSDRVGGKNLDEKSYLVFESRVCLLFSPGVERFLRGVVV